ncbi:SpoIIE family protein phosphatase [Streptomyces kaempferi]
MPRTRHRSGVPPACTPSTTPSPAGAPWQRPDTPARDRRPSGKSHLPRPSHWGPTRRRPGGPLRVRRDGAARGSLLALYTDGLIETRDQDIEEGMRRLGTVLAQPGRSLEDLCRLATDRLPGQLPSDDTTLLLVRTRSLKPTQVASWTLPSDHTAVHSARKLAARQLDRWGLARLQDPTKLIVSELVTNAVRHSTGPIGLRLIQHEALTCEVFDNDAFSPHLRRARSPDENGRGLGLVAQLSRRWGYRLIPEGKVVWAEQDLPSIPSHAFGPDRLGDHQNPTIATIR